MAEDTKVTTPRSKLDHLCNLAHAAGGTLTNHGAVARVLDLAPSRISQLFGHGQEAKGTTLPAGMEGRLVRVFNADSVPLQLGWLYLPLADFKSRFAAPAAAPLSRALIVTPWVATEDSAEPALVEFRLHDPAETNRGLALAATLLFGTIDYDDEGFTLGIREADIAVASPAHRPAEAIGPATANSPHLERIAGGLRATGPRPGDSLRGDALEGMPLLALERTNDGPDDITVTVAAGRRSFRATPLDPSEADAVDPGTKEALVNIILNKALGATAANRPILARATLSRPSPSPATPEAEDDTH